MGIFHRPSILSLCLLVAEAAVRELVVAYDVGAEHKHLINSGLAGLSLLAVLVSHKTVKTKPPATENPLAEELGRQDASDPFHIVSSDPAIYQHPAQDSQPDIEAASPPNYNDIQQPNEHNTGHIPQPGPPGPSASPEQQRV